MTTFSGQTYRGRATDNPKNEITIELTRDLARLQRSEDQILEPQDQMLQNILRHLDALESN